MWREAGGGEPAPASSSAELFEEYCAAAERLVDLATSNLEAIRSSNSPADAKQTIDALWAALFPVLDQVRTVERAWNDLAPRSMARQVG